MVNYENNKKEIQALVDGGRVIIELQHEGQNTFYDVASFEPSVASTTASIDFNAMKKGVDINEFLKNSTVANNPTHFFSLYNQYLEREPKMNLQFSNKYNWKKYYK